MFRTSRIIRYINQNRRSIILVIGVIVGIILIIQLLNSAAKKQIEEANKRAESNTNTVVSGQNIYEPDRTVLTDTKVEETQSEENTEIIDNFVQYCNNGEIQKAYDLLTDECKENIYPTVDSFNKYYCEKIFSTQKTYNMQSWMVGGYTYTYKVRFLENIMASGKYNSEALEDYITIVKKDNQTKLNINYYIARTELNKNQESAGIEVNVDYVDIYKEYEEYTVKVTNNIEKDILLDSLETVKGIKLIGENNVEYQALTNELSSYDVEVPSQTTKTVKIKFSKEYNSIRKAKKIQFLDIILDQEAYKENAEDTNNKAAIEVEF